MADLHGRFLWYEFLSKRPDDAQTFYKKVVGWGTERFPNPEMRYDLWLRKGGGAVGGVMELPEMARKAGVEPHWLVYVGTPRLDKTLAKASSLGAAVLMGPHDIPNVGRIAVLQDLQGAAFALYQPSAEPGAEAPPQPGEFSWHELATSDPEAAWTFYSALFGWMKTSAMDMGPSGVYQMYGRRADSPLGGIYRKPADMPGPSAWLPYAMVDDVHRAAKRITAAGGRIVNGPMEVPGGDVIVVAMDTEGAAFALHHRAKPAPKPAKKAARKVAKKKPAAKKSAPKKAAVKKSAAKKAARKPARKPAKKKAAKRRRR